MQQQSHSPLSALELAVAEYVGANGDVYDNETKDLLYMEILGFIRQCEKNAHPVEMSYESILRKHISEHNAYGWSLEDSIPLILDAVAEAYKPQLAPLSVESKKICYCGSLRVALEEFKRAEYQSVLNGEIALLPCCMFVDIEREYGAESDYKQKADDLHKRKIDIADEVFVLNVGGYIGQSTRSEIDYALSIGKPVKYLEPINQ